MPFPIGGGPLPPAAVFGASWDLVSKFNESRSELAAMASGLSDGSQVNLPESTVGLALSQASHSIMAVAIGRSLKRARRLGTSRFAAAGSNGESTR